LLEYYDEMIIEVKEPFKVIKKDSFKVIGKIEPLKFDLKGFWSKTKSG